VLVILADGAGPTVAGEVARRARVTQSIGQRVLVIDGGNLDLAALRALPGVAQVLAATQAGAPVLGLAAGEALFVDAWIARHSAPKPKQRPGEGRPWDSSGFQPP
jgi:hypothetical protein